ncbi:Lipoprotein signal peptidase [Halomicronema hongdechloris C2206]|uniref:Lipoprotein signal peptidase n=1 Tax=Halomicronema hongdechloris C2206 TaxID=1641165 RepID=A0A1Z3HHI3_9CYAN|nr:signal peptidase II [Halomicronema hongdechloris]ASC69728.1 Lipoprotein signal peptidase [Halomicronema hongdechloris C2206]
MRVRNRLFWVAAAIGLALDQLTKYWVVRSFQLTDPPDSLPLWPGVFHFTYVTNTGAAFSLFADNGDWLRWLSLLVSLGLIVLGWRVTLANRWEQAGYGLILSGALGNGIDRMVAGEVVDFLDFRLIGFPIFNVADVCINLGIACLLIAALKHPNGNGTAKQRPRR